jgi:hypothetical protein
MAAMLMLMLPPPVVSLPRNAGLIRPPKRLMPGGYELPAEAGGEKKLGGIAGSDPGDRMLGNGGSRPPPSPTSAAAVPPELRADAAAACSMAERRAAGESWWIIR